MAYTWKYTSEGRWEMVQVSYNAENDCTEPDGLGPRPSQPPSWAELDTR